MKYIFINNLNVSIYISSTTIYDVDVSKFELENFSFRVFFVVFIFSLFATIICFPILKFFFFPKNLKDFFIGSFFFFSKWCRKLCNLFVDIQKKVFFELLCFLKKNKKIRYSMFNKFVPTKRRKKKFINEIFVLLSRRDD